jgi:hypothetical protein
LFFPRYVQNMSKILAERTLDFRGGRASESVTVRVLQPEKSRTGWRVLVELIGLRDLDQESADALVRGVRVAGLDRPRLVERAGDLSCSFCGKTQKEVRRIIAGPSAYICGECLSVCNDLVADAAEADE